MGLHEVETTPPAAANPEPPTQTSRLFRIKPFADPQNSFGPGLQIWPKPGCGHRRCKLLYGAITILMLALPLS